MSDKEQWATIDLMGHAQTAGRISRPQDWGGLLRVDVPMQGEDGVETYRTEYYGLAAIYSIRLVSEEIARAYAPTVQASWAYDAKMITIEQHQDYVRQSEASMNELKMEILTLHRRITDIDKRKKRLESGAEVPDVPF